MRTSPWTRLAVPLLVVLALAAPARAAAPLTPAPAEAAPAAGAFEARDGTALRVPPGDAGARRAADFLAELTAKAGGPRLVVAEGGSAKGAIAFRRGPVKRAGAEAYALTVDAAGAVVTAPDDAGLMRGAASLWSLLTAPRAAGAPARVAAGRIEDAPRFGWRGLMLDSARHYQSPQFIKALIDVMAAYKLNVFHWHLTDDQGWRLEIRKYPKLTEVGAWRVPAGQGPAADIDPATGKPRLYGGFYTQDQVREIVAYAAARQIIVVPEIDLPGHASAAIAAYPEFAAEPGPPRPVPADWGVYPNLFNTDARTIGFLKDVLDEVMDLFPGPYVHLGGDEAMKDQWNASPAIQAQMKTLGVADAHAMQGWVLRQLEAHLAARGRRAIGWDEVLEGGLPPNAVVMSWRGIDGAVAAAKAGHDAVLAPAPTLYLNHRQSPAPDEPPGRGQVISLEDVYAFDPAPAALNAAERRHILGVQTALWTEHARTEARAWHMIFPRAIAVAELGWSPAATHDWTSFRARVATDVARLRALGVPAAESALRPYAGPTDPLRRANRELKTCSDALTLALEDDAPVRGERQVYLVDIMDPCWIWPDAGLDGVTALRVAVGQLPFNFQIGADVKKIPLQTPRTPAGELEVRVGGCQGAPVATAPLTAAAANPEVTTLTLDLPPQGGRRDLCLRFARASVDPIWAVASVELVKGPAR